MSRRKVVESYYSDICNLAQLLEKYVAAYRLLIGGAEELNTISAASRSQVKKALHRSYELGEIIDDVLEIIEKSECSYFDYCKLKGNIMERKLEMQTIETEIDDELKLDN
jgi:hypothetical protein